MTPSERRKEIESAWQRVFDANKLNTRSFRNESLNDVEWLIARVKKLTEALEKMADYSNPNELKYICYPVNEYMDEARKALEDES